MFNDRNIIACAPPPPPPLSAAPCIRFGHTIPVAKNVDAENVQATTGVKHSWTNYKFGQFSDVRPSMCLFTYCVSLLSAFPFL
eukprot:SAG31_NODE_13328_length_876_cov_1.638353_1_plen_82_part_01